MEWKKGVNVSLLDELEAWVGGFAGRRVLDLGGGPGQYSIAFAKRNAQVTWHDVSQTYRDIAKRKAAEQNVQLTLSIGYMDAAAKIHTRPFDLVFSRICWYYCFSDSSFANVVFDLVKPGGVGYIDTGHSGMRDRNSTPSLALRTWLNDHLAIKIGHPLPPHGRVASLFRKKPVAKIVVDYSSTANDRVLFIKQKSPNDCIT
jgi:2-polyprenyl-3-methyl-5-hydroxy-6-metoxy-1,4-benzoquinol methylase